MAIPVNQLDTNALAAMANMREGNLGLKTVGGSPEGAYMSSQAAGLQNFAANTLALKAQQNQAQIAAANNATQLANTQLGTQGQLQVGQQQNLFAGQQNALQRAQEMQLAQQQNQLGYAGLANTAGIAQGQLGLGQAQLSQQTANQQGQLALAQKAQQQQQLQSQLQMRMQMNQYQLHVRGASAAMGLTILNNSPDPVTADQSATKWADLQLQQGTMNQQEHDAFVKSPLQQKQMILTQDFMMSDMAKSAQNNPGMLAVFGGMKLPQAPEAAAATAIQASRQVQQQNQTMSDLVNKNPDAFTTKGDIAAKVGNVTGRNPQVSGAIGMAAGVAGIDPEYANKMAATQQAIMTQGTALKQSIIANSKIRLNPASQEMLDNFVPKIGEDSPDEAKIKAGVLDNIQNNIQKLNSTALVKGVPVNPASYQDSLNQIIQNGQVQLQKGKPEAAIPETFTSTKYGKTFSKTELQKLSTMHGNMPISEVIKNLS